MADERPLRRFTAVEGVRLPVPVWWRAGGPAWGCAQSHVRVIEEAITAGVESLLVLEDDVCFVPDFKRRLAEHMLALPADWDQFYLGAQYLHYTGRPPWRINATTRQIYNANRTHAYALSRKGMHTVYRWLTDYPRWKSHGGHMHIDHYLGVGHERAEWSVYGPSAWLCGQGGGKSDLTYRDEAPQFWDLGDEHTVAPDAVVVLGPFRSGTSVVGHLISALGGYAGVQPPPDPAHNPYGFFEQRPVVEAYDAGFDARTLGQKCDDAVLIAGLSAVRRAAFAANRRSYLVKYAHLVARPDLLHSVLGRQRHVFVTRDRKDTIGAMRRAWWPNGDDAEHIYDSHVRAAAAMPRVAPHITVAYEDLLANPAAAVARLAEFLGLPADTTRDARVAMVVKPDRPWSAAAREKGGV